MARATGHHGLATRLGTLWAGAAPGLAVGVVALVIAGCGEDQTFTDLNPEGEPEVLQVFVVERVVSVNPDTGMETVRIASELAYGTHQDIERDPALRPVTNAVATPGRQKLRIVFDELLRGNPLEQLRCADGTFETIPLGMTPDDLADCAGPPDVIVQTCTPDDHPICQGPDGPVGIYDPNEDGAPDEFRFNSDNVSLLCGGLRMELDIEGEDKTFWQPSGNQQIPAGPNGIDGLGPAIVVYTTQGLRTGSECTLGFGPNVTDKDGLRPCAPSPDAACVAGDTSGIQFSTEPLRVIASSPLDGAGMDGVPAVPHTLDARIQLTLNATLSIESVGSIEVQVDGVVVTDYDVVTTVDDTFSTLAIEFKDGDAFRDFLPDAEYTVTIANTEDVYGGTLPEPFTLSFVTTAPAPDAAVPDAMPDATVPDATVPDATVPDAAAVPDAM